MSWWLTCVGFFGLLTLLLLAGVPAAISFLAINIVGALIYLGGDAGMIQLVRNGLASITSFSLTPIPYFLLMGEVLFHTGVAMKAIDAIDRVIAQVPARLSVVAVVAGTVFSAISGSTMATTALLGTLLLPEMLRRGYHPNMAMGPIIAIGGVDMLIPPSALTVLLGSLAQISVSDLLVAGIVPGAILSVTFVGYLVARAIRHPEQAPSFEFQRTTGWDKWRPVIVYVMPLVMIFAATTIAMVAGWATPTESAALGAVATVLVAWLYRSLTWAKLLVALQGTASISAVILFIIVGATTFSQILSFSGATDGLLAIVREARLAPLAIVAVMLVILLVLGCFVDQVSMMLITLPFYMPIVQLYGLDPVWFGVLFLICMQLGMLTPPFGMLLFTMKGVAPPHIRMGQVIESAMPYILFGFAMLLLVVAFPPIATWLPKALASPW